MSRILKAPYINIDKNIVIDNTFNIEQNVTPEIDETYEDLTMGNEQTITEEENKYLEQLKEDILVQANEEASKIIEEANKTAQVEAEEIKRQVKEEMDIKAEEIYKESINKGYEEGKLKAEEDIQALKLEANDILEQAKKERENMINSLEPEIINFIIDTTQNILTNSFYFNKDIIALLIKKGLLSVKELKNLKIFVSEEQFEYVQENKDKILNIDTDNNNIEIIEDNSLANSDCIIETEIGTIKCGVDDQLSSIKEALYYILN